MSARIKSDVPELRRLALESLPTRWFQAANCQGGGRSPQCVCVCSGGVGGGGGGGGVVSEPLQKIPAKDVIFRDLCPEDRAWMPVRAVWKPDALTAPAASKFINVLAQICGDGNGGVGSVSQGFRQVG